MVKARFSLVAGAIVGLVALCLLICQQGWCAPTFDPNALLKGKKPPAAEPRKDGKLSIIAFGAHPDDCEIKAGGCAILWSQQGHHVKFVSVTNGDIGHWREAGGPLAQRRLAELLKCHKIFGSTGTSLDIHDGELMPTLENRRTITRLIREWNADVVMAHRPNDYHPDHRYTGVLVQDAAYMVTVPFFCPDVPYLDKNPVFLYFSDNFQKPNPFRPDIVVSIDSVIERKVDGLVELESQFIEGGCNASERILAKNEQEYAQRVEQVRNGFRRRAEGVANQYRDKLIELYGEDKGKKVRYAEAFEVCEYGSRPSAEQLKKLFPFF